MLSERLKGGLLMAAAALCFSIAGVVVRHVEAATPVAIVFWRSTFVFLFILAVLALWHGRTLQVRVRAAGSQGLVSAAFLAATFFFFIFSITHTSVASAMVLMSTGPLFLVLGAWAFLGERPRATTWFALAAALGGMLLMFADGLGKGQLLGNLFALGVPLAFVVQYVLLRRAGAAVDPTVAAMLAALIAALAAAPLAWPLGLSGHDLALVALLGVFQTGLGLVLMTRAYHRLTAGELGLISLLEPVLAPLWVWIGIGENPGSAVLAGGAVVLAAVFANQLFALRARLATAATAAESAIR